MFNDRLNILLVEDDPEDHEIFERMLSNIEGLEYTLEWKSTFDDGRMAILGKNYDVVFMDYRLGEHCGCELLQCANENDCRAPIIFLSAESSRDIYNEIKEWGALNYLDKNEITPNHLAIAIDYAIEIAAQYERLRNIATHDGLTGLYNHREMYLILSKEIDRARRYATPLSIIMFDVDFFKKINDTHGHLVGDNVVKWLADLMRESSRKSDVNARYGGDEFVVILPETNKKSAIIKAENLRAMTEGNSYTTKSLSISVTISAGVSELCEDDSKETFIEKADRALYRAKSKGRNRVCTD